MGRKRKNSQKEKAQGLRENRPATATAPQQPREKRRKRRSKFVDALEELPRQLHAREQAQPAAAQQDSSSVQLTTAASPLRPVQPAAAASVANIVVLPTPPTTTADATAAVEPGRKKRRRTQKKAVLRAAAAAVAAVPQLTEPGGEGAPAAAADPAGAAAAGPAGAPAAMAPAAAAAPLVPAAWTANLKRAWSKADTTKLARLAGDREYLTETIPGHPAIGELDWELIAKHFGRYSKGGAAVQNQYRLVVRTVKERQQKAKKGASYPQLVKEALLCLPHNQGTVLDIQRYLKRFKAGHLDTYKDGKSTRWKKAVQEVLRKETSMFEQVGKSDTNKILWHLRPIQYD
ncbi:hypothetical protein N2152v2_007646 [Parachlorella kessleri]